jgi:ubiquinone/menaquinone biosynthesis C-methylase UbiE
LDLACGEGYNTRILALKGAKVTGIDYSRKLINLAKKSEREQPLGIRYVWKDASHLKGLADCTFDLVTCFMALHDIEDYESAVAEVVRVLKPRGRFVFSVAHPCFEDMTVNGVKINASERYFGRFEYVVEWNMDRLTKHFRTISFPRTLTDYSRVLARNRLLISRLVEPRPTREVMQKRPNLRKVSLRPWSIVFETTKQ